MQILFIYFFKLCNVMYFTVKNICQNFIWSLGNDLEELFLILNVI